jgi:hypothetical protein
MSFNPPACGRHSILGDRSATGHGLKLAKTETETRLQVSLIETRRVDGRVRHEHIASLGSIVTPLSVEGRVAFWKRLHERLAKLANRVDAETQGKLLGAVHARVPMVTVEEQQNLPPERPKTTEQMARDAGWTTSDIRHAVQLSALADVLGDDVLMPKLSEIGLAAMTRAERTAVRHAVRVMENETGMPIEEIAARVRRQGLTADEGS